MKHTQTPWMVAGTTIYALEHDGWHKGVERLRNRFSAGVQGPFAPVEELEANAAFIVRAVNTHEGLVKALESIAKRATPHPDDTDADRKRDLFHCESIARAALSAAKE